MHLPEAAKRVMQNCFVFAAHTPVLCRAFPCIVLYVCIFMFFDL